MKRNEKDQRKVVSDKKDDIVIKRKDVESVVWKQVIQVGIVRCLEKRRVSMVRCYRCWDYGHGAGECVEQDRGKVYYIYGRDGHIGKDCGNEEGCPICNETGHKAGTIRCPVFKSALNSARRPRIGSTLKTDKEIQGHQETGSNKECTV